MIKIAQTGKSTREFLIRIFYFIEIKEIKKHLRGFHRSIHDVVGFISRAHDKNTRQMAERSGLLENSSKITEVLSKISECIPFLLLKSERKTKQVSVVAMVSCKKTLSREVSKSQHLCIVSHKPPNSTLIFKTIM